METQMGVTKMTMQAYMIQQLNGRKWVVAKKSARLVARGYEVFLSEKAHRAMHVQAAKAGVVDAFWA